MFEHFLLRPQQGQQAANRRPPTVQGVSGDGGTAFFRRPDRNSTGHGRFDLDRFDVG